MQQRKWKNVSLKVKAILIIVKGKYETIVEDKKLLDNSYII